MSAHAYWVATLRPWAQAGYLSGFVDTETILLRNEATGDVVFLPRPSAPQPPGSQPHSYYQRSTMSTIQRACEESGT
jgi:hypothetical protein